MNKLIALIGFALTIFAVPLNSLADCPDSYSGKIRNRKANVVIVNQTGVPLIQAGFVHRYGKTLGIFGKTVIEDKAVWKEPIAAGNTSPKRTVNYRTGRGTSGEDYWLIAWSYTENEETKAFATAPNNFIAELETVARAAKKVAAGAVGTNIPVLGPVIGAAVVNAALDSVYQDKNSDTVAGFKKHILRCEDVGRITKIIIGTDQVEFSSESGDSKTTYKTVDKLDDIFKKVEDEVKKQGEKTDSSKKK